MVNRKDLGKAFAMVAVGKCLSGGNEGNISRQKFQFMSVCNHLGLFLISCS